LIPFPAFIGKIEKMVEDDEHEFDEILRSQILRRGWMKLLRSLRMRFGIGSRGGEKTRLLALLRTIFQNLKTP
jgi:hypothetical protein